MALFDRNKVSDRVEAQERASGAGKDTALGLRFLSEHERRISSIKELINPPEPGEVIFLFTEKSFNAFTFIPYVLKLHGQIQELVISTYSINKRILQAFMRLVKSGQITKVKIVVADSLKHQRPLVADELSAFAMAYPETVEVTYAWNHSKITLLLAAGQHYVLEGSGNWSENSRHEQYVFANHKELYFFRKVSIENC
jgi:hypothetical protein